MGDSTTGSAVECVSGVIVNEGKMPVKPGDSIWLLWMAEEGVSATNGGNIPVSVPGVVSSINLLASLTAAKGVPRLLPLAAANVTVVMVVVVGVTIAGALDAAGGVALVAAAAAAFTAASPKSIVFSGVFIFAKSL